MKLALLALTTLTLEIRALPDEGKQGLDGRSVSREQFFNVIGRPSGLGPKSDSCGNCVFPFIASGRSSDRCTSLYGPEALCATSDGNWEVCTDPACPGLEGNSPPMSVSPQNTVGSCYCGIPNRADANKRIVGGQKAETGEFPWQVAILFGGPELYRQGCGGSLVGDKYVVTAAHCTDGQPASSLFVRVGDTSLDEEFEATAFTIGVKAIKQHPDYRIVTNDISILELAEAVSLTDFPNIKPVCLPEPGAQFPGEAIVSGWGTETSGGYLTSYLNEAGVTVFADGDCGSMTSQMTEDMLCAGLMAGGKDACQGDSGGPLVAADPAKNHSMSLVGVVSWGYGCAAPDALGIYAEVSHFTEWLLETMPDLNTCPVFSGGSNNTGGSTPPASSSTPEPPANSTSTTACVEEEIPQKLRVYEKIKKVEAWEECRDACNADTQCAYFRWKNHSKAQKRVCFLIEVVWAPKDNWVSGEKHCV